MFNLLQIELAKLWPAKYFRILTALWLIAFISIPFATSSLLDWIQANNILGQNPIFDPSIWPIFDFEDIWQNLAYIYKMITIFMTFIIIISVTNEYDYKTIRQNVIDGFSKKQFWLSKISLIICFSLLAGLMLLVLGLIVGYSLSPVVDAAFVMKNIEFVLAYIFQVFYLMMFAFFLSILIKRAGITIAIMVFWIYIIEPIITGIVAGPLLDLPLIANSFPVEAGWNLIHMPFKKYLLLQAQDYISFQDISIALAWCSTFFWGSYALLVKRDL